MDCMDLVDSVDVVARYGLYWLVMAQMGPLPSGGFEKPHLIKRPNHTV